MALAIRAQGLGKRYGAEWALRGCSVSVPHGRVSALVGPNGAGKTTLLKILAGLKRADEGEVAVLGQPPAQSTEFLASIGYLAQDVPLYQRLTADEHVEVGASLNRRWDAAGARARLHAASVPTDRPVSTLSGGQRAQVGLSLALAKQPQLLLLDEPVASLDPLARRAFLVSLSEAVADGDLSVVVSSHLLHDLERVCDHVILLASGVTQICDDIDILLAEHRMLVGPRRDQASIEPNIEVIRRTDTDRQIRLVARLTGPVYDAAWEISPMGLEDIILAYMGQGQIEAAASLKVLGSAS